MATATLWHDSHQTGNTARSLNIFEDTESVSEKCNMAILRHTRVGLTMCSSNNYKECVQDLIGAH